MVIEAETQAYSLTEEGNCIWCDAHWVSCLCFCQECATYIGRCNCTNEELYDNYMDGFITVVPYYKS